MVNKTVATLSKEVKFIQNFGKSLSESQALLASTSSISLSFFSIQQHTLSLSLTYI